MDESRSSRSRGGYGSRGGNSGGGYGSREDSSNRSWPNNRNGGRRNSSGSGQYKQFDDQPKEITPLSVPEEYVDCAEDVMRTMVRSITTSKIRNLYSLITDIYNIENLRHAETLLPSSVTGIRMARVRFLYEAGRDPGVKTFLRRAKLLEYLKGIDNNRADLIRFAHYMEALVAYHRFFGGREQ